MPTNRYPRLVPPRLDNTRVGAAVSDAIAALLRDALGRGPSRTRCYIQDDVVVCVLHESLSPVERMLMGESRMHAVSQLRTELHAALRPQASAVVESLTGRSVVAAFADHRQEPDVGTLVFLLADAPSREQTLAG